jgi:DNA modification methylase
MQTLIYKLIFGDSEFVLNDFEKESIDLVVTSPPYFDMRGYVKYDSYNEYLHKMQGIFNKLYKVLKPHRVAVINSSTYMKDKKRYGLPFDLYQLMLNANFKFLDCILWIKPVGVKDDVGKRCGNFIKRPYPFYYKPSLREEYIMVFSKYGIHPPKIFNEKVERSKITDFKDIKPYLSNVWEFSAVNELGHNPNAHPAMYPIELPYRIIQLYSFFGDTVLDPFLGSGTTMLACKQLDRGCVGIELDEKY